MAMCRVDADSYRWYILYNNIESPSRHNPEVYTMEWQLPPGLSCEHCVVQVRAP